MRTRRPRLYVCDLDGTLLRSDATLSPRSRDGLIALIEQGALVTVATARSALAARHVLGNLPLRLPIIECNGTAVTHMTSGRRDHLHLLSLDDARVALSTLARFDISPFVLVHDDLGDALYFTPPSNPAMTWYRDEKLAKADPRLRQVEHLALAPDAAVMTLTALEFESVVAAAASALQESVPDVHVSYFANHYCPGYWELAVQHRFATKANALRKLAADLSIDLADVVVFGDNDNDLSMFAIAGHAVAVANGSPSSLRAASTIIGSNDEDAVVKYIEADMVGRTQ